MVLGTSINSINISLIMIMMHNLSSQNSGGDYIYFLVSNIYSLSGGARVSCHSVRGRVHLYHRVTQRQTITPFQHRHAHLCCSWLSSRVINDRISPAELWSKLCPSPSSDTYGAINENKGAFSHLCHHVLCLGNICNK